MTKDNLTKNVPDEAQSPAFLVGDVSTRFIRIKSHVQTPHGNGIVVDEEVFRTCGRWGVRLEKNPFSFSIVYYFKEEIKKLNQTIAVSLMDN